MGTAIVTYQEKRAAAAAAYVEQVRAAPTGDLLRCTGAGFMLGDHNLGMEIAVCILQSIYVNTLYAGEWSEDVKSAPLCYAYAQPGQVMAPHESMQAHPEVFAAQHDQCEGCKYNEYGTAERGGGKACKNKAKLLVFPVGEYVPRPKPSREVDLDMVDGSTREGQQHYRDADALAMLIPVTSVTGFGKYVRSLAAMQQPPYGVATRLYITAGAGKNPGGFTVNFELIDVISDDVFDTVYDRHIELANELETPFVPPREEEAPAPKGRQPVKNLVRR